MKASPAYPHITERMWDDGYRYVMILAGRYVGGLPRWFDPVGFEEAGLQALMGAARTYDASKGAWTTLLTCACRSYFQREHLAQVNWHNSRPLYSQKWVEPQPAYSLDTKVTLDGRSARFGDFLPGGDEPEASLDRLQWERLLAGMNSRDASLVRRLYEDGETLADLAREAGVSRQAFYGRSKALRERLRVSLASDPPGAVAG
jgi:hypothetical protein